MLINPKVGDTIWEVYGKQIFEGEVLDHGRYKLKVASNARPTFPIRSWNKTLFHTYWDAFAELCRKENGQHS